MSRFAQLMVAWVVLLVLGYALVFGLGGPLPTREQRLAAAMNPPPPVSEQVARESAATIVSIQHGDLARLEPTVERRSDFGIEYWLITYADPAASPPSGVLISVGIETGIVEVVAFP